MLTLFNSLSQSKETFVSLEDKKVKLYVCGITPYDTTHLGHAFTYISFDLLIRFLEFSGYTVAYTQNVTDINDRDNDILRRAKEQNTTWDKLAQFWTDKFLKDMQALNWRKPDNYLFASKEIASMTTIIENIVKNGFGYVADGGVYLDTQKITDFGKLSKLSKDEMMQKAKDFEEDLENKHKKNPLDITLWRPTEANQPVHIPSFNSPWGKGRPGWHIECSAMAIESLREQIDIHGGGIDLMYPHHESEVAQSESATGKKPFSKFWLHTGTVYIDGAKMSKSLGNLILISDLLKKYSANAIRWVLLSHFYREKWEFKENEFEMAEKTLQDLYQILSTQASGTDASDYKKLATDLLANDLQAPKVLEMLQNAIKVPLSQKQKEDILHIISLLGFTKPQ